MWSLVVCPGLIHIAIVKLWSSNGMCGASTNALEPLNSSAISSTPGTHVAPPWISPSLPLPLRSAATVPVPSSKGHQATRAGSNAAQADNAGPTIRMTRKTRNERLNMTSPPTQRVNRVCYSRAQPRSDSSPQRFQELKSPRVRASAEQAQDLCSTQDADDVLPFTSFPNTPGSGAQRRRRTADDAVNAR